MNKEELIKEIIERHPIILEYAKQQAIGFAEWIEENYIKGEDLKKWFTYNEYPRKEDFEGLTTEQLYDLYFKTLENGK